MHSNVNGERFRPGSKPHLIPQIHSKSLHKPILYITELELEAIFERGCRKPLPEPAVGRDSGKIRKVFIGNSGPGRTKPRENAFPGKFNNAFIKWTLGKSHAQLHGKQTFNLFILLIWMGKYSGAESFRGNCTFDCRRFGARFSRSLFSVQTPSFSSPFSARPRDRFCERKKKLLRLPRIDSSALSRGNFTPKRSSGRKSRERFSCLAAEELDSSRSPLFHHNSP